MMLVQHKNVPQVRHALMQWQWRWGPGCTPAGVTLAMLQCSALQHDASLLTLAMTDVLLCPALTCTMLSSRMEYLEGQILEKQGEAKIVAWPSAFVTFSTRAAQVS